MKVNAEPQGRSACAKAKAFGYSPSGYSGSPAKVLFISVAIVAAVRIVTPPPFVTVVDRRTKIGAAIWVPGSAFLLATAIFVVRRVARRLGASPEEKV